MIEVVLLHVAKIRSAKIVVVRCVMNPFFSDVGLESSGNYHYSREGRKEENTQRHANHKQRHQIAQLAAHVITIERPLVVTEMRRVKKLICQEGQMFLVPFF